MLALAFTVKLQQPELIDDSLTDLLRNEAKELISKAVEAELAELLSKFSELQIDGKRAVVRDGYLPQRQLLCNGQTNNTRANNCYIYTV